MHSIHTLVRRVAFVALAVLTSAAPASAQVEEAGNVAVSYSIVHDSELEETFPTGWAFAVSGNISPMLAAVGEIGGNYKSVSVVGTDVNLRVHSFLGGLRLMNQREGVAPFAQVLLGAAHGSVSLLGESEAQTGFAMQPGAGVDFTVSPKLRVRAQGDFRILRFDGENTNEFRFAAGLVFGFGGR
jgi:hypothetical protein